MALDTLSDFPRDKILMRAEEVLRQGPDFPIEYAGQMLWAEIWRQAYLYSPTHFSLDEEESPDLAGLPLLFAWARSKGSLECLDIAAYTNLNKALNKLEDLLPNINHPREIYLLGDGPLLQQSRLLSQQENPAWSFSPFLAFRWTILLDDEYFFSSGEEEAILLHEFLHGAIDDYVMPDDDLLADPETRSFDEALVQLLVSKFFPTDSGPLSEMRGQEELLLEINTSQLLSSI